MKILKQFFRVQRAKNTQGQILRPKHQLYETEDNPMRDKRQVAVFECCLLMF